MTLGEALITLLESYNVDTVFGIPGVHTVELYSEYGFFFDSVKIYDRTADNRLPYLLGGVAVALVAAAGIGWALWKRFFG